MISCNLYDNFSLVFSFRLMMVDVCKTKHVTLKLHNCLTKNLVVNVRLYPFFTNMTSLLKVIIISLQSLSGRSW